MYKVGLIPNMAAYKLHLIPDSYQNGKKALFILFSSLPCSWVGKYNAPYNTELNNQINNFKEGLDLEKSMLIDEDEVLLYFNKFYVSPENLSNTDLLKFQDSISFNSTGKPVWIQFSTGGNNA